MVFKFAARTLLELGKELISSDEVAIYELVKNGIDAGSPSVWVGFNIVLEHRHFQQALDSLRDGYPVDVVLKRIEQSVIFGAGKETTESFLSTVRGAPTDRREFERILKEAYSACNWLEVRDSGHGMSLDELDQVYLTVGTRSRRKDNVDGATYLGDKGVGRLSTMRLGDRLAITTTKDGEREFHHLDIDWSRFGHDVEVDVAAIEVSPFEGDKKSDRSYHGTIVRISNLSSDWSRDRLNRLLVGQIARMIDPFEPGKANKLLQFYHNGERLLVPSVPRQLLDAAHAVCNVALEFENGEPVFKGLIDYRLRNAKRVVSLRGPEVYSVTQRETKVRGKKGHAATVSTPIRPEALAALGRVEIEIYWFNRLIVEAVQGLTEKTRETREQIARWAGGPMLYRYGFRILPYGDPDDDWLELDKKAFGQAGFKLNRQQVIGRVRVNSAHTALSEQTNREGLVDSPAASALKALLMWLLHSDFRDLLNEADRNEVLTKRAAEPFALDLRETEKKVHTSLAELRSSVPASSYSVVDRLSASVSQLADQSAQVAQKNDVSLQEAAEEREKFVHLAGIGLMTEFIFHELDRSVAHALREIQTARKEFPKAVTLKNLEDQLNTLFKRIAAFDALTGERRQVKARIDVADVVQTVMQGHANQFKRHHILIEIEQDKPLFVHGVRGMLIQILENLLSNSVYWLKRQVEYEPGFKPAISVCIDSTQKLVTVTDNGPGIDVSRSETIFQPFVSSKPTGQGRGLGLYISRELAQYHDWKLFMDPTARSIRKGRLNTFVIELGGAK